MRKMQYTLLLLAMAWACSTSGTRNTADITADLEAVDSMADAASMDTQQDAITWKTGRLFPGPGERGYDADLGAKAWRFDRTFWVLHAAVCGLDCEARVPKDHQADRGLIEKFVRAEGNWDFQAVTGKKVTDVITGWTKIPGLYAGMGIGADAYKYALLRDSNADSARVARARKILLSDLDIMHIAFTIGGVRGVVARSLARKDVPGDAQSIKPTPLFDDQGNPLPKKKNNGEWREDNSGLYPDYYWEDSISRDYIMGWAFAAAAASEVIRNDPAFPQRVKKRLARDAADVVWGLRQVRKSGYDLEIVDADGRTTYNGYLNEKAFERIYLPNIENGFYALMALGIVGAFTYAAQDPAAEKYLYEELIKKRKLPEIAKSNIMLVDMGLQTNFSNYNMAFTCAFMAQRYLKDRVAVNMVRDTIRTKLYDIPGHKRQPKEQYQAWYDIIEAAAVSGDNVFFGPDSTTDADAVNRAVKSLTDFPALPCWDTKRENCDQAEIDSGECVLDDGAKVKVLGNKGRNHDLICEQVIPMAVRPPSNYHWRSNPYIPNGGGDGSTLMAGVDFRVAYWTARYVKTRIKTH